MNNLNSKLTAVLLVVLATLASCVKEGPDTDGPDNDNMVTFTFTVPGESTPASRAMNSPDESEVAAMDVLLFDLAANGGGYLNHAVAGPVTVDASNNGTFRVRLPAGTFDMVLVANAATEVAAAVAGLNASSTKTNLQQALTFTQTGKWPAASPAHRPIPMWAELSNVNTSGGGSITGFNLTRALAKINIGVTASNFKLTEVRLYNPVPRGYVIPQTGTYSGTPPKADVPSVLPSWARTATSYGYTAAAGEMSATGCTNEIYTFEAPAGDGTASAGSNMASGNTFLVVGGQWGTDAATTYYRIDIATQAANGTITYHPLKRNHRYEVVIQGVPYRGRTSAADAAAEGPSNIKAELVVRNEADMHYYVYDDRYYIGADDREYRVGYKAGSYSFNVRTDYPAGWRAVASDSETDHTAGVTGNWLTIDAPGTGSIGTSTLGFSFTENTDTENDRVGYIHIMAGDRLDAVVKITQAFKFNIGTIPVEPIKYGYVGAFWKKDQTGERLIRITSCNSAGTPTNGSLVYGDWTATVVEGADWIVLSKDPSTDSGITWATTENPADMNTTAHDIQYSVGGSLTTVTGTHVASDTGEIFFRIGLTDKWSDNPLYDKTSNPARYGIILLEYNDNSKKHLIFVRQGEDADYLMRPEDPTENNKLTANAQGIYRTLAAKWSPYNLTAAEYNNGSTTAYVALAINGGVFTNYPSQAGALFQWASTINLRYAWNASVATLPGWSQTTPTAYWATLSPTHETCPANYRRPNDGSTGSVAAPPITGSEMRQSLWLNPKNGVELGAGGYKDNCVEGYYADGWFDRRLILNGEGSWIGIVSAVDRNSAGIAYRGILFYNPYTYNSLFFPSVGFYDRGIRSYYGAAGRYFSGTSYNNTAPWTLTTGSTNAILKDLPVMDYQSSYRHYGASVRCVEK